MSFQLLLGYIIALIVSLSLAQNTYTTSNGTNGVSHVWASTSDFVPEQSASFGEIRIGYAMSTEFDFVWFGRSCNPNSCASVENYFRVGFTADNGNNCGGTYARYPSLWLSSSTDTLFSVSVSPFLYSVHFNSYSLLNNSDSVVSSFLLQFLSLVFGDQLRFDFRHLLVFCFRGTGWFGRDCKRHKLSHFPLLQYDHGLYFCGESGRWRSMELIMGQRGVRFTICGTICTYLVHVE